MRQVSSQEGLDGTGYLIGVLALWKGSLHNLIDDRFSVSVLWVKNLGPKLLVLSLNQVSGLHSVEVVLVGDLDELLIAFSPGSLIGSEGKVWVSLFAVFTNDFGIIVFILD